MRLGSPFGVTGVGRIGTQGACDPTPTRYGSTHSVLGVMSRAMDADVVSFCLMILAVGGSLSLVAARTFYCTEQKTKTKAAPRGT